MVKKKAPGRPRVRDRKHLTSEARIEFRVSPADKATMERAAAKTDESVGEWLRRIALEAAKDT